MFYKDKTGFYNYISKNLHQSIKIFALLYTKN